MAQAQAIETPDAAHEGRIGPNAIIRVGEALAALEAPTVARGIFAAAGIERHLDVQPEAMVRESEVLALHRAMRAKLGPERSSTVSWIAGQRTAEYLLANRIPRNVQGLLKALPAPVASRILVSAIKRNSWTFSGSGRLTASGGHPTTFEIADCPICRGDRAPLPLCGFYAATFERLFAELVHADARAVETACSALGAPACRFVVSWRRRVPR